MSTDPRAGDRRRLPRSIAGALMLVVGLAAHLSAARRPIRFDRLSMDEGLSQSTVLTLIQDSEGFIWLGTEDGLNRFDGYSFTHYHQEHGSESALASDFVYDIAEDRNGDLWIATEGGGLALWERKRDRFRIYRHDPADAGSLGSDAVRTVHVDSNGTVWVGTKGAGLDRLDPETGRFSHYRHRAGDPSSLSHDEIFAIHQDAGGALWIGSNGGLDRLDPQSGQVVRFRHDPAEPSSPGDNRVRAITEDRGGTLWISTDGGGLSRLDPKSEGFIRYRHDPSDPKSLAHDTVRSVLEDGDGRLWVGTVAGLSLLDRQTSTFDRYSHDPSDLHSLGDAEIMSLYQDRSGILWVGTRAGGVAKWNPRTWSMGHHVPAPTSAQGLSHRLVTSFSEDRAGRLWVGTMGGGVQILNRVTGEVDRQLARTGRGDGLTDDRVMALLHDHRGAAWIGTMTGGLNRYDPDSGEVTVFRHDPDDPRSLGADAIMSLFEDRRGRLFVGTFGGGVNLYQPDTGTFRRYTHDPGDPGSLSSSRATSFAQDPSGGLWVGTEGGGLNLLEPETGRSRAFGHDPGNPTSLSSDTVYALHVDAQGTLWVGTRSGLDRTHGSSRAPDEIRFETFSQKQGLLDDTIYGIQSDPQGHLWLSTNRGLYRYDPAAETFRHYSTSHGLQAEEFNFGAHFRSTSGELFFGGINGFNAFFASRLEVGRATPPVVLTAFLKLNEPVPIAGLPSSLESIELGYRDDVVTFEFAALDFASPRDNRYAYMLEGFDSDWIDLGTVRRVTYTDLDRGSYLFRVRGASSDRVWNEAGTSLSVVVLPAPWETWWAYTLYVLAVGLGLLTFVRSQQRKVDREAEYSRRLEEEVNVRTAELEDRNSELKAVNRQLLEASLTDALTGLRNRRFLFEQVSKDIALVRRRYYELATDPERDQVNDLVFMMVDLDHFKAINDNCGHAAGDKVLLQVRDVLLRVCRSSDIVIRWGGDEFLVIGRDTDGEKARGLAERLRNAIAKRVFQLADGQMVRTSCSVGFACFPFVRSQPDLMTWEQIITLADTALYEAKKSRNSWVGYLSTDASLAHEDLFRSIRENPEEMVAAGALEIIGSEQPSASESLLAS